MRLQYLTHARKGGFTNVWKDLSYVWIVLLADVGINIALLVVFLVSSKGYKVKSPFAIAVIVVDFLIFIIAFLSVALKDKIHDMFKNKGPILHVIECIRLCLWFVYLIFIVLKISYAVASGVNNPLDLGRHQTDILHLSRDTKVTLIVLFSLSIVSDFCVSAVLTYVWIFTSKRYFLMFLSCLGQFFLGILEMNVSNSVSIKDTRNEINPHMLTFFIHAGAFLMTGGLLGVCLCVIISEKNRLSDCIRDFIFFIDCYFSLISILTIVAFALSLKLVTSKDPNDDKAYDLVVSSAVLGSSFILAVIIIICSRYFRRRQPPKLEVEVLDLTRLTSKMKNAYAALIDMNHKFNSGVLGKSVLDLMEAYCGSPLDDMTCTVLRVYRPTEVSSNKSPKPTSSIWDTLDEEKSIFNEEQDWKAEQKTLNESGSKPLSKNKMKRLAKKAQKKKDAKHLSEMLENSFENRDFNNKLEATEAIVMLTSIEDFDLTCTFTGRIGTAISNLLGKGSRLKLLCVRFGILGFHWPFKRSTFYCSKPKRPVARSAAVMYAIAKWNSKRSSKERCTLLLDPIYKSNVATNAINFGGWVRIPLPASHIIDLRPHKSQTLHQYLKSIKYRAQNGPFDSAHGEVIEHKEFDKEECDEIISMWSNIAESRSENGHTSTLTKPDAPFIQSLGKIANENKDRTLLFLKVGEEIVASCILFRLGDTITSDIQGLNHEISRQYRAYFVMMQEVIRIALKEGKSFVDFGPTTEKPKLDIGCQNVPLIGAMHAHYFFLNPVIALSAKKVDV